MKTIIVELTEREVKLLMNSNAWYLMHKEDIKNDVYDERLELDHKMQRIYQQAKKGE